MNYFQRKFVTETRRCDEMERKLRYIEAELKKDGVYVQDEQKELPRAPNPREITVLEVRMQLSDLFVYLFLNIFKSIQDMIHLTL